VRASQGEEKAQHDLFIATYASTGDATLAAKSAKYAHPANAGRRMMKPNSLGLYARKAREKYLQKQGDAFQRQHEKLVVGADAAIDSLIAVSAGPTSPEDKRWSYGAQARVQAAVAILDRAGHMPVQRIEQVVPWEDVSREIATIDVMAVLSSALLEVTHGPIVSQQNPKVNYCTDDSNGSDNEESKG